FLSTTSSSIFRSSTGAVSSFAGCFSWLKTSRANPAKSSPTKSVRTILPERVFPDRNGRAMCFPSRGFSGISILRRETDGKSSAPILARGASVIFSTAADVRESLLRHSRAVVRRSAELDLLEAGHLAKVVDANDVVVGQIAVAFQLDVGLDLSQI